MYEFKWIDWNRSKVASHNVSEREAAAVVKVPFRGFPRRSGTKRVSWGQTPAGVYLQVVYVIEPDDRVFIIHARPLTEREKRRARSSQRR